MKKCIQFVGKKVLVLGLGVSGFSVAKLLHRLGADVTINDSGTKGPTAGQSLELQQLGISYIGGGHDIAILHDVDYVIKNPGIPYYVDFIQEIVKRSIPILTEPEVAAIVCEGTIVALTGTNGKTTTTMLIYEMLKNQHEEVYFAGNIGVAFSDVAQRASKDAIIVLELSSFQLMGMPTFKPHIAMILNLDEAHLDFHKDSEEYTQAKMNILHNVTSEDYVVYNLDDEKLRQEVNLVTTQANLLCFSAVDQQATGAHVVADAIFFGQQRICAISDIVAPGKHNVQNVLAAITVAKLLHVDTPAIFEALGKFIGVEHRLEYVQTLDGVRFYNDSKATNVKAAQVALASFSQPIVWLAGGLDRGNDISDLRPFCENVKAIVAFGQSRQKFVDLAEQMKISSICVDTIVEAVHDAFSFADAGDVILLSPACASWDQFVNFEARGALFKSSCRNLSSTIHKQKEGI